MLLINILYHNNSSRKLDEEGGRLKRQIKGQHTEERKRDLSVEDISGKEVGRLYRVIE